VVTGPGSGYRRCRGKNCVHVTGSVVTEYRVTTTVTLPRASNFRRLTRFQKERVQDAINNVLAPHEQEHVDAFETYDGTTEQPFDLNLCRNQLPGVVRKMVRDEERPRREEPRPRGRAGPIRSRERGRQRRLSVRAADAAAARSVPRARRPRCGGHT
jgi:hypothetical protein